MNVSLLTLALLALAWSSARAEALVIRAGRVHTLAGPAIERAVIVVENGRIAAVGPEAAVRLPVGARELRAAVVIPGLVDARGTLGLSGLLNQPQDQDVLDRGAPMQPALRAIDAYNARDELIAFARSLGVTTVNTGPAPGALIPGQTAVFKLHGRTADADVIVPSSGLSVTLGKGGTVEDRGKAPGSRAKSVSLLRSELIKAREYHAKRQLEDATKRPALDLALEQLAEVLQGETRLLVTAHRAQDILAALRLAQEFQINIVLDGAADAAELIPEIKAAGCPVVLHPTMGRASDETSNLSFATAARLFAAGIPFAIQSGYEPYVPKTRVILFEAAIAVANGLPWEAALEAITLAPARILALDERIGTIQVGRDADLALFDGDPFEYTTHCVGTVIDGVVYEETR